MPFIRNESTGSDTFVSNSGMVPSDGSYTYNGTTLRSGSSFDANFPKGKPHEETDKKSLPMGYTERMRGLIERARTEISSAENGRFRPSADKIAPKDVRTRSGNPLEARQLTPYEFQLCILLGWMQAHRESGTLHGIKDAQSDFEKKFEGDISQILSDRGDEVSIYTFENKRDFLEYEQIFKDEIAARSAPLAQYSKNLSPDTPTGAPLNADRSDSAKRSTQKAGGNHQSSSFLKLLLVIAILFLVWYLARMGVFGYGPARMTHTL